MTYHPLHNNYNSIRHFVLYNDNFDLSSIVQQLICDYFNYVLHYEIRCGIIGLKLRRCYNAKESN